MNDVTYQMLNEITEVKAKTGRRPLVIYVAENIMDDLKRKNVKPIDNQLKVKPVERYHRFAGVIIEPNKGLKDNHFIVVEDKF